MEKEQPSKNLQHQQSYNDNDGYTSFPSPRVPSGYVPPGVSNTVTLEPSLQQGPNYQQSQDNQPPSQSQDQNSNHDRSVATHGEAQSEKEDGQTKKSTNSSHSSNTSSEAAVQPQINSQFQSLQQGEPYYQYPNGQPNHSSSSYQPHPPTNQRPDCQYSYHNANPWHYGWNGTSVPNFPPPNASWSQHQQNGYGSQFAQAFSQNYPTTCPTAEVSQPTASAAANGDSGYNLQHPVTTGSVQSTTGYPYTPESSSGYIQQTCLSQQSTPTGESQGWFVPQTSNHSGMPSTQSSTCYQPFYNGQTNMNYFSNQADGRGMYATEVTQNGDEEERRRAMAYYENERQQRLYMTEGITKRLVINPNVNIEAQINQEYLQQCLQGLTPESHVMERLYGNVNINAAGQTHNIAGFDITNVHHTPHHQFHVPDNPHAIQHTNFLRPPPPYPMSQINMLAVEAARNEAKNAEMELSATTQRRLQAEAKMVSAGNKKRKMKARSQRMTYNQREAYLRFQYCGRETRNTRNYMNTSEDGLEEYLSQLEFEDARMAENRASAKMNAANEKLRQQLEEVSRLEAAHQAHQHPPPAYDHGGNYSVGGPMRQPAKRGRRPQAYQTNCRRSNAAGPEYAGQTSVPPPPSYPGPSQQHHTPFASYQSRSTDRNPPDYYQAVGSNPSEFRIQHPRRNAAAQPFGYNQSNAAHQAAATQGMRRPARRATTQKSAQVPGTSGTQQHHGVPHNRYGSAGVHPSSRGQTSQLHHGPASNSTKTPTAYPVRQTRATSRMYGDDYFNTSGSWRLPECHTNRSAPNATGHSHIPTQMAPNTKRPVFPTGHQSATNTPAAKSCCKPPSKQDDSTEMHRIEDLIPSITEMSNSVFERCLKEMAPEVSNENKRTGSRSQSYPTGGVQTRAGTSSSNAGSSTSGQAGSPLQSYPTGRVQTRAGTSSSNAGSSTSQQAGSPFQSYPTGGVQQTRAGRSSSNAGSSTSQQAGSPFQSYPTGGVQTRAGTSSSNAGSSNSQQAGSPFQSYPTGGVQTRAGTSSSNAGSSTIQKAGSPFQSYPTGRVQTRAGTSSSNAGSSTSHQAGSPFQSYPTGGVQTRAGTSSSNAGSSTSDQTVLEQELDEYFMAEAKRIQERAGQDDFDLEELLKE